MKKMLKRIFGIISAFILGTQSRIFAIEQTDVYGPPPELKSGNGIINSSQPTVYGPAPDSTGISTMTWGQLFSIIASILLFVIGILVILNKNIKKKNKVTTVILLSIIIIALLLLAKFVF